MGIDQAGCFCEQNIIWSAFARCSVDLLLRDNCHLTMIN